MVYVVCELCGNEHSTNECKLLSSNNCGKVSLEDEETLAQRTLPKWVSYHPLLKAVFTNKNIEKYMRFGPVLAPQHTEYINASFPLKVFLPDDVSLWVDQSNKRKCCWLSLIPSSPSNYNLTVYQIENCLYYVASKEISKGDRLFVWYSSYYKERLYSALPTKKELEEDISFDKPECVLNRNDSVTHMSVQNEKNVTSTAVVSSSLTKQTLLTSPTYVISPLFSSVVPTSSSYSTSVLKDGISSDIGIDSSYSENRKNVSRMQMPESTSPKLHFTYRDIRYSQNIVSREFPRLDSNERRNILPATINSAVCSKNCSSFHVTVNTSKPEKAGRGPYSTAKCSSKIKVFTNESKSSIIPFKNEDESPEGYIALLPPDVEESNRTVVVVLSGGESATGKSFHTEVKEVSDTKEILCSDDNIIQNEEKIVSCLHCRNEFFSTVSFATHIKEHLQFILGKLFICKECDCSFHSLELLSLHQNYLNHNGILNNMNMNSSSRKQPAENYDKYSLNKNISEHPLLNWVGCYRCQICKKLFHQAQYLLRHMAKHIGSFACHICSKTFSRKESLLNHNNQFHQSLSCEKCQKVFTHPNLYKAHCSKHCGPEKCEICGKYFANEISIKDHRKKCGSNPTKKRKISLNEQKPAISCNLCGQKYVNAISLNRHKTLCESLTQIEEVGESSCSYCGFVGYNASEFRRHHQIHTHPYTCLVCNQKFKSRGTYEVHICSAEYNCDECNDSFTSLQGLNRHLSVHRPPPYSCDLCKHTFFRKESSSRHRCKVFINSEDSVSKKGPACQYCHTTFFSNYNLKKHIASFHNTSEKKFSCSKCGKGFHRSDLLKDHERTHLPPSFHCPKCSKAFKSKRSLKVHATLHSEDYRFLCRYCNKAFPQKSNLKRHEKSHAPVGSVKCQHCGCKFRSTQHLERHLLNHTDLSSATKVSSASQPNDVNKPTESAGSEDMDNSKCSTKLHDSSMPKLSEVTSKIQNPAIINGN